MEPLNEGGRTTRRESLKKRRLLHDSARRPGARLRGERETELGIIGLAGMGAIDAPTLTKLARTSRLCATSDSAMLDLRGAEYTEGQRSTPTSGR